MVGANMENGSYGLSICAEVAALSASVAESGSLDVEAIAVVGAPRNAPAGYDRIATPCGRCRQLILEAAHCARHDVRVLCSYAGAPDVARTSSAALLPYAFGPLYLERG